MHEKSLKDMLKKKNATPADLTPQQQAQMELLKRKVDQYKDKDMGELMHEIDKLKGNREVRSRVKSGELDTFADSLKPMLNNDQQRKLDDLVRYLHRG